MQVKARRVAWAMEVTVEAEMRRVREAWGTGQRAVGTIGELALREDQTHQYWMGRES